MNFEKYPNFQKFKGKNILSVDYGTKVTGLAFFCPGKDPYPYPFSKIVYQSDEKLINDLKKVIRDESIDIIVIGIPRLLDEQETTMTKKVMNFGENLKKSLNEPVYFQDETLSTFEAKDRMKNSPKYNFQVDPKQIDALSASIILEDFIRG